MREFRNWTYTSHLIRVISEHLLTANLDRVFSQKKGGGEKKETLKSANHDGIVRIIDIIFFANLGHPLPCSIVFINDALITQGKFKFRKATIPLQRKFLSFSKKYIHL